MKKQIIDAENFKLSLREALMSHFEIDVSINRVKGFIANLPAGNVHFKNTGNKVMLYHYSEDFPKKISYLPKSSPLTYQLCRKRYLALLLKALELLKLMDYHSSSTNRRLSTMKAEFDRTQSLIFDLIDKYHKANLDIARVVLTNKQYKWFTSNYRKKNFTSNSIHKTRSGIIVRSKSERDAGNCYESYAIPYHYEELLTVNVLSIVNHLHQTLSDQNQQYEPICYERNGCCHWNVPSEFNWMNLPGSAWRSYNPVTGKIYIYNDFHIMLADGNIIVHEHEGLLDDFLYRNNSTERVSIIILAKAVPPENIITTTEEDIENIDRMVSKIKNVILPRLWF